MAGASVSDREAAEEAAARWIAHRGTPEWNEADSAAFGRWLQESASHRVAYYRLNAAWEEAGRLAAFSRELEFTDSTGPLTEAAERRTQPLGLRRRHTRFFALAASVILALAAGVLWLYHGELLHSNRYTTVVGGLAAVPLSDGSRVTLNTDSELNVALTERERQVDLTRGEAFFEVARDPTRPFVVNAGHKRVIAVGTQFSVYRQGDEVRVTVAEGTVRLEDRSVGGESTNARSGAGARAQPATSLMPADASSEGETVLLPAGTIALAKKDAVLVEKEGSTAIEQKLSWRSGVLTFRETPLADAIAEFNRYNERKIVIEDPAIATLKLGGVFRSTNVDPFIVLLEQGFPVRAREEGDRIALTHN